jgi:hypothetical protein
MARRSQVSIAEDDATMATNDDMRERIQKLETKFDRLEKKVDQLPTRNRGRQGQRQESG